MDQKYDVIVIGLGAMGSASTYQLAKAGKKVLGIDQYEPPHVYGSSHGETRITRQAIAEGEEYVPLVLRANEIWRDIERQTDRELYVKTGILIMASNAVDKPNKFVDNTIAAAVRYGIEHENLSADEIRNQYPQFNVQGNEKGYFENGAGYLNAEACIEAQLQLAKQHGAQLHMNETFISYEQTGGSVIITTNKGTYHTEKIVLTVGPWVQNILPDQYKDTIKIYRQVLYWFELEKNQDRYVAGRMPVFNWEFNTAHEDFMYGFPSLDGKTIKIATEQYDVTTLPGSVNREVADSEARAMYDQYISGYLPDVSLNCIKAEVCLYSAAPDWRFLIDYHPDNRNVIIASPCSGHGFKHSAAIGEAIAEMAMNTKTTVDIRAFSFDNLG